MGDWDVSAVTDFSKMFLGYGSFVADLGMWDTSSATIMSEMFSKCTAFNSDISGWDVSSVTTMNRMFKDASTFNIDLSPWDVSSVTDMRLMFTYAASFSQQLCSASWLNSPNVAQQEHIFTGTDGAAINCGAPPAEVVEIPSCSTRIHQQFGEPPIVEDPLECADPPNRFLTVGAMGQGGPGFPGPEPCGRRNHMFL